MKCEQVRELLSPYMDQMTNTKENNAITAHLAACPECRKELEELQAMTAMMRDLYTPELPDTFAHDLRQRLHDEKISILRPRELKTPSKAGWIAAAVALVAMGTGIFTSSFVPINTIIAYQEQQINKTEKKSGMSVEEILSRIKIWDNSEVDELIKEITENNEDPAETGQEIAEPPDQPVDEPPVQADPEPVIKIADIYSARIKVDNTDQAIDQVIHIAQANKADYEVVATSSMMQAFSAGSSQMVELKVAPDQVDSIVKELGSMGMIAAPMHDETVLTDDYVESLNKIEEINVKIEEAKSIDDQVQLKKLNKDLYEWTLRKDVINKEINQATIRVFLVEEINP